VIFSAVPRSERALLAAAVLLTVLAGVGRYVHGFPAIVAFILAALALGSQAWIVSNSTERVGERLGTAVTGTMQATVGNLPEFFVVLFALIAHDKIVAETAILGSIFSNALLVLGIVLVTGSLVSKDQVMRFSPRLPTDATTLLLVASFIIVLLALVNGQGNPAGSHTETISLVGAVAILIVYGTWMRQYLRSGGGEQGSDSGVPGDAGAAGGAAQESSDPAATRGVRLSFSVGELLAAGVASAFTSDWFIRALEPTIHDIGISQAFAGLVIVAIAGNAVEHVVGIVLAARGKSDLAISVVKSSVAQIAAFLYPLLVLVSLLTATHLTFALAPVYVGALIGTAILVWQITGDGEATPFEGAALIATFVVLATVAAFEH
jgi:Ca2+:H+ antiporter